MEQAHGRIRKYYLITSGVAVLVFPLTWVAFRLGAPVWIGYAIFLCVYVLKAAAMLWVVHRDTGFPVGRYFRTAVLPMFSAVLPAALAVGVVVWLVPVCWWRFLVVAFVGLLASASGVWLWGLTPGEKGYVRSFRR